jgi:hypothetical protein
MCGVNDHLVRLICQPFLESARGIRVGERIAGEPRTSAM